MGLATGTYPVLTVQASDLDYYRVDLSLMQRLDVDLGMGRV
ncbi:MAG: hypothetical protein R3E96_02975 [Planctomycetota bacterium]